MTISQLLLFVAVFCVYIYGITGYSVSGKYLLDPNGNRITLRGVCRPSFEWNANGEHASYDDYALMKNKWNANAVRISLNQDFWLAGSSYAATIDQQITWIRQLDMGVILDLHWNQGGQQNMADKNSITFWSQVAARYKNNPWVMFELYNEPKDVSWSVWLNGDSNYAGMQDMYDAVRAAGADNTVIVGGLNWAFDLSGVISGVYKVQGKNIAYATHPYDYEGKRIGDWTAGFGALAATAPVIMTEFGQYCNSGTYVADLLNYAELLGIHYTAWAWYVNGCQFPSVISDWNGTPFPGVGEIVKSYVGRNAQSSTSGSSSSGSASTPSTAPTTRPTSAPSTSTVAPASGSMSVFSSGLKNGWQDWSWSTSYSLTDSQFVRSGSNSIRFEAWKFQGVYLHAANSFAMSSYDRVEFYVNGGTSAKSADVASVKVYSTSNIVIGNSVNLPVAPAANEWKLVSIPVSAFGLSASTQISGIVFQSNVDSSAGNIWVADVAFVPAGATSAPTKAPTTAPTTAPTKAPTTAPTKAPTTAPTSAPTKAPTSAPTTAPTKAPTTAPTTAPTSTKAPTTASTTAPKAPSDGCDTSSVKLVQSSGGSWDANGKQVTQYNVEVSHTCSGKKLVGLTITASNWNPVNFWNVDVSGSTISLPSYASFASGTSFGIGYQNVGGQASLTVTSVTFQ